MVWTETTVVEKCALKRREIKVDRNGTFCPRYRSTLDLVTPLSPSSSFPIPINGFLVTRDVRVCVRVCVCVCVPHSLYMSVVFKICTLHYAGPNTGFLVQNVLTLLQAVVHVDRQTKIDMFK